MAPPFAEDGPLRMETGIPEWIPERAPELIFRKFHQSENGRLEKPGGTGLGLPICRHIVGHYGGGGSRWNPSSDATPPSP
ncbi:hypothetical protein [Pseudodesulfovibrio indicus]|uniref:hypothetical protein n=1 Tax=Pseudodesulfovibrio indicus TaxID=1716143 RepID=UPI002931817E|nr:hypothetical protein [Pseudodesulfovibrio indicus]